MKTKIRHYESNTLLLFTYPPNHITSVGVLPSTFYLNQAISRLI